MAFKYTNKKGTAYYLHSTSRKLKSGKTQTLYYFSKESMGALDAVPAGYMAVESRTGLPVLKKK